MIHTLNMVWNPSEGIDLGFFLLRFYSLSWVLALGSVGKVSPQDDLGKPCVRFLNDSSFLVAS